MATPYAPPQSKWVRIAPEWIFLGAIAGIVAVMLLLLLVSNVREIVIGLLAGVSICTIGGFAFYLWRKKEIKRSDE